MASSWALGSIATVGGRAACVWKHNRGMSTEMLKFSLRAATQRFWFAVALLGLVLAGATAPVQAGPGHSGDEGHAHDAPAAASSQSPRIIATSENFQLVGILKSGRLTLYLDREPDNSPVVDAMLTVTGGDKTVVAEKQADGTYAVAADALAKPGENELQFEIKAGEQFDLLGGVLAVPATAHGSPVVSAGFFALLRGGSSTAVLGAAALVSALFDWRARWRPVRKAASCYRVRPRGGAAVVTRYRGDRRPRSFGRRGS